MNQGSQADVAQAGVREVQLSKTIKPRERTRAINARTLSRTERRLGRVTWVESAYIDCQASALTGIEQKLAPREGLIVFPMPFNAAPISM